MHFFNDIYAIDNKKICSKNEEINNTIGKKVSKLSKEKADFKKIEKLFIAEDINLIFKDENYKVVFKNKDICSKIAKIIRDSYLENNVILELENIEKKFPYTYRHILDVTVLTIRLVLYIGTNKYDPIVTSHVGLTHDLGKSRIPREILYKTSMLATWEWKFIKTHPAISYLLLLYYPINYKKECLNSSFNHHEKLDGTGYPRGISNLSKYTKLITPVDMLDALLSSRPYRNNPYTLRSALDCLQEEAEQKKIDKDVVYYLISLFRKDKPDIKNLKVGRKWREDPPEDNFYGMHG